jgi:hypothetical protein
MLMGPNARIESLGFRILDQIGLRLPAIYRPNVKSMCYTMYVPSTVAAPDSNHSHQCSRLKPIRAERSDKRSDAQAEDEKGR